MSWPSAARTRPISAPDRFVSRYRPRPRSGRSRDLATRPSFAPKPVIDIRHIRQNPGLYEQNCKDRNYPGRAGHSWRILELHEQWKGIQEDARRLRERNNHVRRETGLLLRSQTRPSPAPERVEALIAEARELKARLGESEQSERAIRSEIDSLALELPNLSSTFTPEGKEPRLISYINRHLLEETRSGALRGRPGRSHTDIGARLDLLDFAGAASTSGWGWYFLRNEAALLEQALVQYAIHTATTFRSSGRGRGRTTKPDGGGNEKWTLISPPSLVYSHISSACGFQPRDQNGEQQIYTLGQPSSPSSSSSPPPDTESRDPAVPTRARETPTLSLTGTAEIPLAGMNANKLLDATRLPQKLIASSRCYRAEAGARGTSTKGLYRVHEFTKVEMFAWTLPGEGFEARGGGNRFDTSGNGSGIETGTGEGSDQRLSSPETPSGSGDEMQERIFHEMLEIQKAILSALELPCRILEMPSSDLGASATRKIDIEAWFPSRVSAPLDPEHVQDPEDDPEHEHGRDPRARTGARTQTQTQTQTQTRDDGGWGEVSSLSTCGAYQSRRLAVRVKMPDGSRAWPHTVNGTALAVPRVLAAVLENGWDEGSQSVVIPKVLRPFMGGQERICKSQS